VDERRQVRGPKPKEESPLSDVTRGHKRGKRIVDEYVRQTRARRRGRKPRTQVTAPAVFTSRVLPGKRRVTVLRGATCPGSQIFYLWCSIHKYPS
jgi:hypothetical protein